MEECFMSNPKVSVIMSVYNGEKYLQEAIESILNQTFENFEFIIVNDAATDKTKEILECYKEKDSRIRIITNTVNIGLTKSLNKIIKRASGVYLARMDADDIALPQRLEKQVDFLRVHPEVGLLGTSSFEINKKGDIINKKKIPVLDSDIRFALIKSNPFFHSSVMMRKAILEKAGGYDKNIEISQDYELWFRIAKETKMANLDEFLMKRRYTGILGEY